jgi:hypothetical protein
MKVDLRHGGGSDNLSAMATRNCRLSKNFDRQRADGWEVSLRCGNRPGGRKRRYKAAFIAKLSDAESEASETQVWIELARRCDYLADTVASRLEKECDHSIAQLVRMIDEPGKWLIRKA